MCPLVLGQPRVDLVHKRYPSLVRPDGAEEHIRQLDQESGGQEDNSLEILSSLPGSLRLTVHQFENGGEHVLKTTGGDDVLRHLVMGRLLVFPDGLDKLEVVGVNPGLGEADDALGDGGREEKGLALDLASWGQELNNLLQLLLETNVQHAISLIQDKGGAVGSIDTAAGVGQDIVETTRSGNEKMATPSPHILKHLPLPGAANSSLHNDTSVLGQLLSLLGNLLGQFSGGRHDDGTDIVSPSIAVSSAARETGVLFEDPLEHWYEEGQCLASTGLCLSNPIEKKNSQQTFRKQPGRSLADYDLHVLALEGSVDGRALDIGHVLIAEILCDRTDNGIVDAQLLEVGELGDGSRRLLGCL